MGNRDDEFGRGFGFGSGMSGYDPDRWEGPIGTRGVGREPTRIRRYHPDEDMGGSEWSGASGRGGIRMNPRGPYVQSYPSTQQQGGQSGWSPREHGGFSNYAGGGDRDRETGRFFDRDREMRGEMHGEMHGEMRGEHEGGPYAGQYGGRQQRGYGEREGWYGMSERTYGGEPGRAMYEPGRGMYEPRGEWSPSAERERGPSYGQGYGEGYDPRRAMEQRWGRGGGTDMGVGEREMERGPHYGKGPKGYKRSDERIREEVCEVISRQGFIDASDVEVSVERGVVLLGGTVTDRQDKRALEQMAERVHGVEEVRNELRLKRDERREQPAQKQRGEGRTGVESSRSPQQPNDGRNARS